MLGIMIQFDISASIVKRIKQERKYKDMGD